jgi:hypothetical protein
MFCSLSRPNYFLGKITKTHLQWILIYPLYFYFSQPYITNTSFILKLKETRFRLLLALRARRHEAWRHVSSPFSVLARRPVVHEATGDVNPSEWVALSSWSRCYASFVHPFPPFTHARRSMLCLRSMPPPIAVVGVGLPRRFNRQVLPTVRRHPSFGPLSPLFTTAILGRWWSP